MAVNQANRVALVAATFVLSMGGPAYAGKFDGDWSMVVQTTRGHCGTVPVGMGIKRGRIFSTGGSFAFYAIKLGGSVSGSGRASIKAVAGPRVARGSGRFKRMSASGTWTGTGPSGRCSGVWRASR
jgi:hypothetical protein